MVVEALEYQVRGRRREGLAEAPEKKRADGVVKARAHLEEGEEVRRREGLEDYGEDLVSLGGGCGARGGWVRTSLGRAAKELCGAASFVFGIVGSGAACVERQNVG